MPESPGPAPLVGGADEDLPGWTPTRPVVVATDELAPSIPYVGPLPQPSRASGSVLQLLSIALAAVALYRASIWWRIIGLGHAADARPPRPAVRDLMGTSEVLWWVLVIGVFAMSLGPSRVWFRARRSRDQLVRLGEAHVETNLAQVLPLWFRLLTHVLGSGGFVLLAIGYPMITGYGWDPAVAPAQLVACVALALAWASNVATVAWMNETFQARVDASSEVRDHPDELPFFAPVDLAAYGRTKPSAARLVVTVAVTGLLLVGAASGSVPAMYAATGLIVALSLGGAIQAEMARRRRSAAGIPAADPAGGLPS